MTFHPLTNETGGDAYDAMVEKDKIIKIIHECGNVDVLSSKEQGFLAQMEEEDQYVSPKQLLWLRDIKDKCI
jgi:hypothetical protein